VLGRDLELSRRTDASALGATRLAAAAIGEAGAWEAALAGSGTEGTERVSGACLPWIDGYFEAFQEGYRRLAPQLASDTEQTMVQ
jgi:hypothetical protein